MKSTIAEIRERFDNDVERFSNLETGQQSTIDATISLELITEAAKNIAPDATHLLDIGCGAGNYTLKMLSKLPGLHCTLVDLSQPMLSKAFERVSAQTAGNVETRQGDIRELPWHLIVTTSFWREPYCITYAMMKTGPTLSRNCMACLNRADAL